MSHMMAGIARLAFAGLVVIGLSGCDKSWTWHQRITVTVQTPYGPKAGSSVHEATMVKFGWWQRQWGYGGSSLLKGEAAAVEIAPGKYLFALLEQPSLGLVAFSLEKSDMEYACPELQGIRGTRELARSHYPVLVTFGDVSDPLSVKEVDPANLGASFGPGYSLDSVTVTITDEKVTQGNLERILRWLGKYPETRLGPATGRTHDVPFYRKVSQGDFIRR